MHNSRGTFTLQPIHDATRGEHTQLFKRPQCECPLRAGQHRGPGAKH